jgi:hypothetical protein
MERQMSFFNSITRRQSPFSAALIGEAYFTDPVFLSNDWFRTRPSQGSLKDRRDTISRHSFLLREGRVNELNFELPSELTSLLERIIPLPLVLGKEEPEDNATRAETFLLLYHTENSGRVDTLIAVPSYALGVRVPPQDIDDAIETMMDNEDFPCCVLPLRIAQLALWPGIFQMELTRGRQGFYSLPIPKILFEGQSFFIEDTIVVWLDRGSGSLIMLKNSFCDVVANMDPFRSTSDLQWSGLNSIGKNMELLGQRGNRSLLDLDLPSEWEQRLKYYKRKL